jgi:hypothetical protein
VPTYVRWYWPDDNLWCYEELDDRRWCVRHIEVRAGDGTIMTAAALAEVLAARDVGGVEAVRAYEAIYGVAPESALPIQSEEYPIEAVDQAVFDDLWRISRSHLDAPTTSGM